MCTIAGSFFAQSIFLLCSLLLRVLAQAPYDPSPITLIGRIDAMTLEGNDTLSGGSITVDGMEVIVPDNLLVTLPSIAVAWSELFKADGSPNLPQWPDVEWEATIYGNRVDNKNIAGLVYIAQMWPQALQGFISNIDFDTGHFWVQGDFSDEKSGIECVLNDPLGRFGRNYTDHPLWTVDAFSPSVTAMTGFPVCIPRSTNDPDCPNSQRPGGQTIINFGAPPVAKGRPDPFKMVPLQVGDYITFSGTEVGKGLLAVYTISANLGLYTSPGTKPSYIIVEDAQFAIVSNDGDVEGETRAVAYTTDPTTNMQWFAIDVDPCTGEESERNMLLVKPDSKNPAGQTVFRGGDINFNPATREVGFRMSTGTVEGPGGIIAGEFIQPIMDAGYIFPELTVFGNDLPENQFFLMDYLRDGSGPYESGAPLSKPLDKELIVGQLNPWPGSPIEGLDCSDAAAVAARKKNTTGAADKSSANTTSAIQTSDKSSINTVSSSTTSAAGPKLTSKGRRAVDTVIITEATVFNQKSMSHVSVRATTSDVNATLFFRADGRDPISNSTMTSVGGGLWLFNIDVKGRPDNAFVDSSSGGSASAPFTRA